MPTTTTGTPGTPAKRAPRTKPQLTLEQAAKVADAANAALVLVGERELAAQKKAGLAALKAKKAALVAARTAAKTADEANAQTAELQQLLEGTPELVVTELSPATAPATAPVVTPATTAPVAAAPVAPVTTPVVAPVVSPTPARFLDTWRNTSIWAQIVIVLAAVIGAVIFLLVGKATAGIIHWGTSEWPAWLSTVTVVIWYAGLIVGGFGLGGWLAARWFARRR